MFPIQKLAIFSKVKKIKESKSWIQSSYDLRGPDGL